MTHKILSHIVRGGEQITASFTMATRKSLINPLLQFLRSGNTGRHSVLGFSIVSPFWSGQYGQLQMEYLPVLPFPVLQLKNIYIYNIYTCIYNIYVDSGERKDEMTVAISIKNDLAFTRVVLINIVTAMWI